MADSNPTTPSEPKTAAPEPAAPSPADIIASARRRSLGRTAAVEGARTAAAAHGQGGGGGMKPTIHPAASE